MEPLDLLTLTMPTEWPPVVLFSQDTVPGGAGV